jgi:OOP family OmpA-OmpF porin
LNNNNVPDELESYLLKNYAGNIDEIIYLNNDLIKKFNQRRVYVTCLFQYNLLQQMFQKVDFILKYLRNNPASVDIIGHADELGRSQ